MESYTDLFKDDDFFEIEIENNNNTEKLPIELFREIEVELLDCEYRIYLHPLLLLVERYLKMSTF